MSRKSTYKTWLKQASFDLEAAKLSFRSGFNEWAAYQAEQSVEKALKSVIIHAGERVPKVHKLSILFGICNSVNRDFRDTKFVFAHVESFTFISRYPFLLPGKDHSTPHEIIKKSDAAGSIKEAEQILSKIEHILESEPLEEDIDIPEPITHRELEERLESIQQSIIEAFSPEKIILFGSYARKPLPDKLTTMDILVVAETELSFLDRIKLARKVTKGGLPTLEPLVYTPEEFRFMTEDKAESFLESALEEGRVVYEAPKG